MKRDDAYSSHDTHETKRAEVRCQWPLAITASSGRTASEFQRACLAKLFSLPRNYPMRLLRSTVLSIFLASASVAALTMAASAQIAITVDVPPPPLPDYDQPEIPDAGYIWTPGYWTYDDDYGYYWVPGTWIFPPQAGLLWTPGYWAYDDGNYVYYDGYWGDQVGYYGGVDYGYGYEGDGYDGGYWRGGTFFYNRTANNINNVTITNVYSKPMRAPAAGDRVSYNGGDGGITLRPTQQQQAFAHEHHVEPTPAQREHVAVASHDPSLRESHNKGRPTIAATARPDDFKGQGVIAAKAAGERPSGQPIPQGKKELGKPNSVMPESKGAPPHGGTNGQQQPGGANPDERPSNSSGGTNVPGGSQKPVMPEEHRAEPKPQVQPYTEEHKPAVQPHETTPAPYPMMQQKPAAPPPHPEPMAPPPPHPQPMAAPAPHPQAPPHHPQPMAKPAPPAHPGNDKKP